VTKLWASQWERYLASKLMVYKTLMLEYFLPMSTHTVTKLLWTYWESLHWLSCPASKLLREKVARQVIAGGVAPYVEVPSDKSLVQSLGESLPKELISERQVTERFAGRSVPRSS
jgi:hypothetical protein